MWKVGERKEEMPAPITLPPLDEQQQADLQQRYEKAADTETRTRYQMIMLAQLGHTAPRIAAMVLRSEDTVARVLKRFLSEGLDAVPRRTSPGWGRTITSAWEAELLRVIELDPARRWARKLPTGRAALLADYLGQQTGVTVTRETVRVGLHAHGYGGLATELDVATQSRRESGLSFRKDYG